MEPRPSVSEAIARRGLATEAELEEALARQVIYGGDLDLNILELEVLSEAALLLVMSDASGLQAVDPGPLPIDLELTELMADLGVNAAAGFTDDGIPVLFVDEPLPREELNRTTDLLGREPYQLLSLRLRLHEARHFAVDAPLTQRERRLVDKLGPMTHAAERPPGARLIAVGPMDETRAAPSAAPANPELLSDSAEDSANDEFEQDSPLAAPPPVAPIAQETETAATRSGDSKSASGSEESREEPTAWPPEADQVTQQAAEVQQREATAAPPADYAEVAERASRPPMNTIPPRLVTYSLAQAQRDLTTASGRDAVIDILVAFGSQFFEYFAVFAVQSKEARGLAAAGHGAPSEALGRIKIPLDLPSAFAKAKQSGRHGVSRLRASGLEGGVTLDLERPTGQAILLLPIQLMGRTVLMVWGDQGAADATEAEAAPVLALSGPVSSALERILRDLKANRVAAPPQVDELDRPDAPPPHGATAPGSVVSARPNGPERAPLARESATRHESRRTTSLALPHIEKKPEQRQAPPPPLGGSRDEPASSQGPIREPLRDGTRRKREPTHRNLVAPEARAQDWTDSTEVSAGNRSESHAPSTHQVAAARRQPLDEARTRFPSDAPKTLKGFPATPAPGGVSPPRGTLTRAPETPSPSPRVGKPLLSRRIVPVQGPAPGAGGRSPHQGASVNEPSQRVPDAPIPDLTSHSRNPGSTQLSRQASASMRAEPPEDGWDPKTGNYGARRKELKGTALTPSPSKSVDQAPAVRPPGSYERLVQAVAEGSEAALEELAAGGEAAVGALISLFPGPVSEDDPTRPAAECGPVLKALAHIGSASVPFLTVRTADENADVRRWATRLLGDLKGREAAKAIAGRLLDDSPEVRRAALASARAAQSDLATRRTLRSSLEEIIRDGHLAEDERIAAIEAIADIREYEGIPTLLQCLENDDAQISRSASWALSVLTRHDFGRDASKWQQFWQQHRDEHRIEWLILALDQSETNLRRAAADELRVLVGDDFGYQDDLQPGPLRSVQARFRAWWEGQPKN